MKIDLDIIILILILSLPFLLVLGPLLAELNILFIFLLMLKKIFKYKKFFFLNIYVITFLFFCFFLILSSLLSDNILLSLESSLFYFRFLFLSFFYYYLLMRFKKFNIYFIYVNSFLLILLSLDALIQYFYGYNILMYQYQPPRLSGLFGDEYKLGSFLVKMLLFTSTIFLIYEKNFKNKFLYVIVILLSSLIIFLTGERTSIFYLILSFILFFPLILKYINLRSVVIISIFFISIFYIVNSNNTLKQRLFFLPFVQANLLNNDNDKIFIFSNEHEFFYKTSIKIFKENIFFGSGPKTFRHHCPEFGEILKSDQRYFNVDCSTHTHNYYIQLLSETGIFIFILSLSLYIFVSYCYVKNTILWILKKNIDNFQSALFCLPILVIYFPFIPTGSFFNNWNSILNHIITGFIISYFFLKKLNIKNENIQ